MKLFSLFLIHCWGVSRSLTPIVKSVKYHETYRFMANSSVEYTFELHHDDISNLPPRVTVTSSNAQASAPLMIASRQTKQMISWQLPLVIESEFGDQIFTDTARTLCYDNIRGNDKEPFVTVSTASNNTVDFSITLDEQEDFYLQSSKTIEFVISPGKPKYFLYNFTHKNKPRDLSSDYETVILEVQSNDSVCMTVSIQNFSCPVFDSREDVTFRGFYETVNTKGGITIPKYKFRHGFFAVFVVNDNDKKCGVSISNTETNRTKIVRVAIRPNITYDDYIAAVFETLGGIGIFYLVFLLGFCCYSRRCDEFGTRGTSISQNSKQNTSDEPQQDIMSRIRQDPKHLFTIPNLNLSQLAMQNPDDLRQNAYLYLHNVLIVAIFYGLPVIQLVATYQKILNNTGQQDICYYNFLCAHPVGSLSDFNHVFSNIGYVMLGFLFLVVTKAREQRHRNMVQEEESCGIPQHYGFFYAMGVALIVEGVLSGCYHVCPNNANIQFDLSFMYAISMLSMVSLYQKRHPDINARAYSTFGILAIIILFVLIKIFDDNVFIRVTITILYILMCLYISFKVYYFGCFWFDFKFLGQLYNEYYYPTIKDNFIGFIKPKYTAPFILLTIGNLCNFAMAIFVAIQPFSSSFGFFVLGILMLNTILYFGYYIIMKLINKERVIVITWIFLTISIVCAGSAMYCFLQTQVSWSTTPAMSRQLNQDCELIKFYDSHDIWHFLSAIAVFFIFMTLLTLDDDLTHTLRTEIHVF